MSNSQKEAIEVCLETMADCLTVMRAGSMAVGWKIDRMGGSWADCNIGMSRVS